MNLVFKESVLEEGSRPRTLTRFWEASKFPFRIRIGLQEALEKPPVYRWTLLGTYIKPEVVLGYGSAISKEVAEHEASSALGGLLRGLRDWVVYTQNEL